MYKITSPLEQFIVSKPTIFSCLPLFTSLTFNVFFIFFIISFLLSLCNKVTNYSVTQYLVMRLFFLVSEVVTQNVKLKKQIYILHLFIIFLFILLANLVGLLPYSFSLTSHFSVTFFISFSFWFFTLIIGIKKNGWYFFKIFLPVKVPILIAPLLIYVEIISYLIRPFSLAIRLSANMLVGHILLKIVSSVAWALVNSGSFFFLFFFWLPILILFLVMLLELIIAFLQAYVFLVLMTIYLNEAINI